MAVLEHQALLKGVFIERIYDRLYTLAHKGVGFRIYPDVRGVRYLFNTDYYMHGCKKAAEIVTWRFRNDTRYGT